MSHMPESSGQLHLSSEELDGIRIHEKAWHMPSLPVGCFVHLDSDAIMAAITAPAFSTTRLCGKALSPSPGRNRKTNGSAARASPRRPVFHVTTNSFRARVIPT